MVKDTCKSTPFILNLQIFFHFCSKPITGGGLFVLESVGLEERSGGGRLPLGESIGAGADIVHELDELWVR